MIYKAQSSHVGSNLSCIDILTVLFEKMDVEHDVFIVSKGWVAASVYYFLHRKNIVTAEELDRYCAEDEKDFIGLIEPRNRFGMVFAGGSMGFGLPAAIGFALAKKQNKEPGKVYVLMSDGEMDCGTTWESALIAAHHKLANLVVIIDNNGLQATGETDDVLSLGSIGDKFKAFGWKTRTCNGHRYKEIERGLSKALPKTAQPLFLNAYTIKGKGVPFMEGQLAWHYKNITEADYKALPKEYVS